MNAGNNKIKSDPRASNDVITDASVRVDDVSADKEAFGSRGRAGVSEGVEQALLEALAVVTLLLRHEVSNEACLRWGFSYRICGEESLQGEVLPMRNPFIWSLSLYCLSRRTGQKYM